jgi:hypothetical protein
MAHCCRSLKLIVHLALYAGTERADIANEAIRNSVDWADGIPLFFPKKES